MKKQLLFSAAAIVLMASCVETDVIQTPDNSTNKDGAINFVMQNKNMTRSYTDMQMTGHYNFGVFAYKSTDKVNPVMPNYLVGYYDEDKAYQKAGTTWGDKDGIADGVSYWMYEGMGSSEYNGTYAGGALTAAYTSNNANQYLKYWDNSADYTYFYAYAPYINGTGTATYVDGTAQDATGADTYVLTIPNGTLTDGYDDPSLAEYMYASAKVAKANYGHDVALQFHRLNAKVNIKFWEDVPGYKVRILDLGGNKNYKGVQAAASIDERSTSTPPNNYGYKAGKYYRENGIKIQFADGAYQSEKQFAGTTADNTTPLEFASPTEAAIGTNRYAAAASPTTYYAIPKWSTAAVLKNDTKDLTQTQAVDADLAKTGFTFHVSYELTAEDTGEKIVVSNATVHVPYNYCEWKGNTHYTYIFKITKNTNGTTNPDNSDPSLSDIDPTDPEVPTTQALYPIVFDNCTVVDWDEIEGEWNISDEATRSYHNITLKEGTTDMYSFKSDVAHVLTIGIDDQDIHNNHAIDWTNGISVTGPDAADENTWLSTDHKSINVPANAAAGTYTVTYTCPSADINGNHPATWTQTFFIGNAYTVDTHRDVIGTNWSNSATEAKLTITTKKDGTAEGTAGASGTLSIVYPDNVTPTDLVSVVGTDVVVKKTAAPGVYKLVYKITEGTKQVVVAEKQFTVVDYSLTLSHTTVFNTVGGTTVTGNQTADANHVYTVTGPDATNVTVTSSTNEVVVANNAGEGTYTVTYTVFGTAADETVYTKTFVVKNTYAVTLSTSTIDYDEGWDGAASSYGSEFITVTPWVNGIAKTSGTSTLAVKQGTVDKTSLFTLTDNGNGTYKLQVKPQTAVTGNYTVEFTENGVTSTVDFVVTH